MRNKKMPWYAESILVSKSYVIMHDKFHSKTFQKILIQQLFFLLKWNHCVTENSLYVSEEDNCVSTDSVKEFNNVDYEAVNDTGDEENIGDTCCDTEC